MVKISGSHVGKYDSLLDFSKCELVSLVRIVSGYGLDDRAIEVRSLAEAKGFFL
jgi:hypothetical protein